MSEPQPAPTITVTEPERVYDAQPNSHPAMNAQQPQPQTETTDDVDMRGGDDGGCCPGRFCFIIPCPIPIDCCIFPCC